MMKRNPLEKKKSRTKVQLMGKKVIAIPSNTVILNSTKISPGIYSHAFPLVQHVPRHAQLEEKVHNKTWAYLQSIMKYIFKYKS